MKQKLIIANLKMNLESVSAREAYIEKAQKVYSDLPQDVRVVLCPSHGHLERFANFVDDLPVTLGAQDCFWEIHGSYTGQISPKTIADFEATHVIIGHSERRVQGDTDLTVAAKTIAALRHDMIPVVCVGFIPEGMEETDAVERQVETVMAECPEEFREKIVFAYEPVWAIGSGKTPTGEEIHSRVILIKRSIAKVGGARDNEILYGGSVNAENVAELCEQGHTDGAIIGGASLRPEELARIVKNIYIH